MSIDLSVAAYTDRLSYRSGESLTLFAKSDATEADISLVRYRGATLDDTRDEFTPVDQVAWSAAGRRKLAKQRSCVGAFVYAQTPLAIADSCLTVGAWIWLAEVKGQHRETVVSLAASDRSLTLALNGATALVTATADGSTCEAKTQAVIAPNEWWFVSAAIDGTSCSVSAVPRSGLYGVHSTGTSPCDFDLVGALATVTIAGRSPEDVRASGSLYIGRAEDLFNGKIEEPFVVGALLDNPELDSLATQGPVALEPLRESLRAGWDFAPAAPVAGVTCPSIVAGVDDAVLVNLGTRGVTGTRWSGKSLSFVDDPRGYAAIHFHESALVDAGWTPTLTADLPNGLGSGIYGIAVSTDKGTDVTPIFVLPDAAATTHKIAVLMPTFSYLAYGNENLFDGLDVSKLTDADVIIADVDQRRAGKSEYGLSLYDHHQDGSGVCFSGARRPIMNMRVGYNMWLVGSCRGFSADMFLIEWLERRGLGYDIITDEVLHQGGAGVLAPYGVVLTGSHPEYYSEEMLDGVERYRDGGGKIMYLGGNGFYWVTGVVSEAPLVVEIRRGHAGIRTWESRPGELILASTGLQGGLWRHRGRAPQRLVGVGMCAQGWGQSEAYTRTAASQNPEYEWIFDGVSGELFGDHGRIMGGAAGDELDRFDLQLGSPPKAVIVASSSGHTIFYQRALEEVAMNLPDSGSGVNDSEVRSDVVYFKTPGGGAVFSVGSMAWLGSLLDENCANDVSRITENVIRAFMRVEN